MWSRKRDLPLPWRYSDHCFYGSWNRYDSTYLKFVVVVGEVVGVEEWESVQVVVIAIVVVRRAGLVLQISLLTFSSLGPL